jgi:hypothetical protein
MPVPIPSVALPGIGEAAFRLPNGQSDNISGLLGLCHNSPE